jgi:hypothetical protein
MLRRSKRSKNEFVAQEEEEEEELMILKLKNGDMVCGLCVLNKFIIL